MTNSFVTETNNSRFFVVKIKTNDKNERKAKNSKRKRTGKIQ